MPTVHLRNPLSRGSTRGSSGDPASESSSDEEGFRDEDFYPVPKGWNVTLNMVRCWYEPVKSPNKFWKVEEGLFIRNRYVFPGNFTEDEDPLPANWAVEVNWKNEVVYFSPDENQDVVPPLSPVARAKGWSIEKDVFIHRTRKLTFPFMKHNPLPKGWKILVQLNKITYEPVESQSRYWKVENGVFVNTETKEIFPRKFAQNDPLSPEWMVEVSNTPGPHFIKYINVHELHKPIFDAPDLHQEALTRGWKLQGNAIVREGIVFPLPSRAHLDLRPMSTAQGSCKWNHRST